jgi:hypothetical protein
MTDLADNRGMKLSFLILFSASLFSLQAFGENAIATGGAPDVEAVEQGAVGSLGLTRENLEFALEAPGIKEKYEACKTQAGSETLDAKVSSCLWDQDLNNPQFQLTEDEQRIVTDKIDSLAGGSDTEANKLKFESLDNGFLKQANQEPSFRKLQEHMVKKLEETIYGDQEEELIVADHTTFHKLYKSQLTKNVIQAMSSYCLDADSTKDYLIDKNNLAAQREKNIKALTLGTASMVPIDPQDPSKGQEKQLDSEKMFNSCVTQLKEICYSKGVYANLSAQEDPSNPDPALLKKKKEMFPESKTRACNVVTYIKQLKQNIIAVTKIETKLEELDKESGSGGFDRSAVDNLGKVYMADKNESLTVLSSKEFVEESGFKKAVEEEEIADFEKCFDKDQQKVLDEEACKKYLSDDKEGNSKLIAEADTRSRALGKKMEDSFAEDKKAGVETYLKDQAFTDDQIANLISTKGLDKLKDEITARYRAEREAYIETLTKRIKSKTKDDKDDIQASGNIDRLKEISKELTNKTKSYTELVHFTNVVSGYLKTAAEGSSGAATGRNTTALAVELGNSAYDPNAGAPSNPSDRSIAASGGSEAHTDAIKAAAESIGINPEVEENKDSSISADTINSSILGYE